MNDSRLDKIERDYDAESDMIPGGPDVTWAEHLLALVCSDLQEEIAKLRKQVSDLEAKMASVDKSLYAIGSNPALE
jgi:hypothetical protein